LLEGARIALRCDNPLIQLRAAACKGGIAEAACFLGDSAPYLVRVWPDKAPARRVVWLIMHQAMRRSARIRAVSNVITEAFRSQRRILEQGIRGRISRCADVKGQWCPYHLGTVAYEECEPA
jgi:DNA-binding transcriptional LysR family regulator